MNVAIYGTGRAAETLCAALAALGETLVAVWGRNAGAAHFLAAQSGAQHCEPALWASKNVQVVLLAVSDRAIADVAAEIPAGDYTVAHVAGAASIDLLGNHEQVGVLWPMASLGAGRENMQGITFLVEGSSEAVANQLQRLGTALGGRTYVVNAEERLKAHAAATVVNNFGTALWRMVEEMIQGTSIHRDDFATLGRQTLNDALQLGPRDVQTGPALRGDKPTLQKHLDLLGEATAREVYQALSTFIAARSPNKD